MNRKRWIILVFVFLFSFSNIWGQSLQFKSSEAEIKTLLNNIEVQLNRLKSGQRGVNGYAIYGFNTPKEFIVGNVVIDQYFDSKARIKALEEVAKALRLLLNSIHSKNSSLSSNSNNSMVLASFRDDFNSFNPKYWEVYEWGTLKRLNPYGLIHSGVLDLRCNRVDRSPFIASKAILLKKGEIFTLRRRVKVHYANKYFEGGMSFYQSDRPILRTPKSRLSWASAFGDTLFSINYFNYIYEKPGVRPYVPSKYGFALSGYDWRSKHNYGVLEPIWNRWFIEELSYDTENLKVTYSINGRVLSVWTLPYKGPYLRFIMHSYGWYTGHNIKVDWLEWSIKSKRKNKIVLVDTTDMLSNLNSKRNNHNSNQLKQNSTANKSTNSYRHKCKNEFYGYISAYNSITRSLTNPRVSNSQVIEALHIFRKAKEEYSKCIGKRIDIDNSITSKDKIYGRCALEYKNYIQSYNRLEKGIFRLDDFSVLELRGIYLKNKSIYENCLNNKNSFKKLNSSKKDRKIVVYSGSILNNVIIATKKLPSGEPDSNSVTDHIPNGKTPFYIFVYYQGAKPTDRIDLQWYYHPFGTNSEKLLFNEKGGKLPASEGVFVGGPIYIEGGSFPSGEYHLVFFVNSKKAIEKYFTIGH